MLMAQNRNKNIFLGGKTTGMQEKKLKTLLCMVLSVNKKILFFCLQFPFKNTPSRCMNTSCHYFYSFVQSVDLLSFKIFTLGDRGQ